MRSNIGRQRNRNKTTLLLFWMFISVWSSCHKMVTVYFRPIITQLQQAVMNWCQINALHDGAWTYDLIIAPFLTYSIKTSLSELRLLKNSSEMCVQWHWLRVGVGWPSNVLMDLVTNRSQRWLFAGTKPGQLMITTGVLTPVNTPVPPSILPPCCTCQAPARVMEEYY